MSKSAMRHRVVFVSLIGLFHSFRRIPTHILFSSIFCLNLKREWLYNASFHTNDPRNLLNSQLFDCDDEFMMLLKWKDSQGLLFFMHHDDEENDGNTNNSDNNEEDEDTLPEDLGIENSSDEEEDGDVMGGNRMVEPLSPMMNAMDDNAFEFAANISIASPTQSMAQLADFEMDRIVESHGYDMKCNRYHEDDGAFGFDVNMHEVNMTDTITPQRFAWNVSLESQRNRNENENGVIPHLPLTPSGSEEVADFVPPLRLQRENAHFMVNVLDHSGYDSPSPRRGGVSGYDSKYPD